MNNIERFKTDFKTLISTGDILLSSMQYECFPKEFEKQLKPKLNEKYDDYIKKLKSFKQNYQKWYSESLVLIRQLLPDRIDDFVKLYEKPKNRKVIEYGNYVIEDYLQSLTIKSGYGDIKVGPEAAICQFQQQLCILESLESRFESSLFDVKLILQADLFDSELEAAMELNKNGFFRGAGAIAGVVLEKHLAQVCKNHKTNLTKSNPSISDFNDKLKNADIYDTPTWRKIQHMGDLRNLCDHNKNTEPTKNDVSELIHGVEGIIKTLF